MKNLEILETIKQHHRLVEYPPEKKNIERTMSSNQTDLLLSHEEQEESIRLLQELVRVPTVSTTAPLDGSYKQCAEIILRELKTITSEAYILHESLPEKPIIVATILGTNPQLPGILLNCHYDVVPVATDLWTVPPFEAIRKDNKIYGRGTQDMKCVCSQYLIALKKLFKNNQNKYENIRNIHITYVPDEEIGGIDGMNILTNSAWFISLNLALALDEGLANTNDQFTVFYGERLPWWIHVKASGNTGHGSRFIEGTAVEQVIGVVNKALTFRKEQQDLLHGIGNHAGCSHAIAKKKEPTLGDVTSINVTMLKAGVQAGGKDIINVIPPSAEAGFDVRISPHTDPQFIADTFSNWCHEVQSSTSGLSSNQGVSWEFFYEPLKSHHTTSINPDENPWWTIFSKAIFDHFQIQVIPDVFPAATDSRFLRALGVKVFGFSPMRLSPILLHENDEYIDEKTYIEGCNVYTALIKELTSVTAI